MKPKECWVCKHPGNYDKSAIIWMHQEGLLCGEHLKKVIHIVNPFQDREPGEEG